METYLTRCVSSHQFRCQNFASGTNSVSPVTQYCSFSIIIRIIIMPPLNNFVFDEPVFVSHTADVDSPSSFDRRSLEIEDPWKFAFPPATTRQQKSVSFSHQVEIQYVPSRCEWTEEETNSRWNSEEDYTNFHLDLFNTIYLIRNEPEAIDDICHSARGVECRDPITKKRRRLWKSQAWDVVFEQQKLQRARNTESSGYHYLVASLYSHFTQVAMRSAIDTAAQDEIDARRYQSESDQTPFDEPDLLNDTWVTSVSTSFSESSSLSNSTEVSGVDDDFGFYVFGEKSDFDNSWLRMES